MSMHPSRPFPAPWVVLSCFVVALAVMAGRPAEAATYVNRVESASPPYFTIQNRTFGSQTWTPAGSPYIVEADVTVTGQFTIEPGIEVQVVAGGLYAQGTFSASGSSITGANWKGIYLSPNSGDSVISNMTISGAGALNGGFGLIYANSAYRTGALYLDKANATVANTTITGSQTNGIRVHGANPTLTNNTFHDIGGEAHSDVLLDTIDCYPVVSGNSGSGTGNHGIRLHHGTTTASGRLRKGGENFPYLLTTENYTVSEGHTLTVDPGVTVRVLNRGLYARGTLKAQGTAQAPITFTTLSDTPEAGQWLGIYLAPTAAGSVLDHARILYSGAENSGYGLIFAHSAYRRTALYVDECAAQITNTLIAHSGTNAIELYNAAATVRNNAFENMGEEFYAVHYDTPDTFPDIADNTVSGTGFHGVHAPGGNQYASGRWQVPGTGLVYFQTTDRTIANGRSLAIDPGVTVMVSDNAGLYAIGVLKALGTAAQPVRFLDRENPAPGAWKGIYIGPNSGDSELRHTRITHAGAYRNGFGLGFFASAYRSASLFVHGASPTLDHIQVLGSERHGIEYYNSASDLTDSRIEGSGHSALVVNAGSRFNVVRTAFVDNGSADGYTVSADPTSLPTPTDVTMSGNTRQGIEFRAGTMSTSSIWKFWAPDTPYVLTGTVQTATDATLTVAPNTVIKAAGTGLLARGGLVADGTAGPITFTSLHDDSIAGDTNANSAETEPAPGDWLGIYIGPGADSTVLRNVTLGYSGAVNNGYGLIFANSGYRFGALYLDKARGIVTDTTIINSETNGIRVHGASPTLTGNTFQNTGAAYADIILDTTDCYPVVSGNSGFGTGIRGIELRHGTTSASGRLYKGGVDFPYLLTTGIYTVGPTHTLTVDPGTTVRVQNHGFYINGTLKAGGAALDPITFTTLSDTPQPGQWLGIYLGPNSGGSVLAHVKILYAGAHNNGYGLIHANSAYRRTAVYVSDAQPLLENLTIAHAERNGLEIFRSEATINSSLLHDIGDNAIVVINGQNVRVINSTIANSGVGVQTQGGAVSIINTIMAFNDTGASATQGHEPTFIHSAMFGNGENYQGYETSPITLLQDPLFVDAEGSDYRLQETSPYINAGSTDHAIPGLDLDGNPRIHGPQVDLGAYEFGSSVPYTIADVALILRIAGGLEAPTSEDFQRFQDLLDTGNRLTLQSATRAGRMLTGLERQPD